MKTKERNWMRKGEEEVDRYRSYEEEKERVCRMRRKRGRRKRRHFVVP